MIATVLIRLSSFDGASPPEAKAEPVDEPPVEEMIGEALEGDAEYGAEVADEEVRRLNPEAKHLKDWENKTVHPQYVTIGTMVEIISSQHAKQGILALSALCAKVRALGIVPNASTKIVLWTFKRGMGFHRRGRPLSF